MIKRRAIPVISTALCLSAAVSSASAKPPATPVPCAADAGRQALKLLRFDTDNDARATIDLASMRSLGTVESLLGKHRFNVIEVEGSVYKGNYRIRLIYAPIRGVGCVLMGQEILERSDPY